jgi:hypothetical protein
MVRGPSAVAGIDNEGEYLCAFMADRCGWVWALRIPATQAGPAGFAEFFVNCGAPPSAVTVGSPRAVAASGYLGAFVVGMVKIKGDNEDTPDNGYLFELQRSGKSWIWTDPDHKGPEVGHGPPPGTQAVAQRLSVVTGPSGYMGIFLVGQDGNLWERRFLHQRWDWIGHGGPPNTPARAVSAIIDNSGQVCAFVTGKNGHLYQWRLNSWFDHGTPPDGSAVGGSFLPGQDSYPSFVAAPSGYIGGLVLGESWHIYELSSTDGVNFAWTDHGPPQGSAGGPGEIVPIVHERGSPSFLAASDGYLGALVVGAGGFLSELYRADDGSWKWISIATRQWNDFNLIPSDPSYVATRSGHRGGFVSRNNGHLYEVYCTGTGHNWMWNDRTDLGGGGI